MSRSKKKNIIKDRPRNRKKSTMYWRTVRRVQNQKVKSLVLDPENNHIPEPKTIVNDYDYCDYIIVNEYNKK